MKKIIIVLLVFISFTGSSIEPVKLNVMTYNLRFGELSSLEEIAKFIVSKKPDLVALQELDWMTRRIKTPLQHDKDFITELGFRTGMFPLYGKTISYAGGLYGIGILTRKPYINVEKIILPKAENVTEYRALLLATIELNDTDTIVFASTHLDYSSYNARKEQIDAVVKKLKSVKYPVLLGGDLNSYLESDEIKHGFYDWAPLSNSDPTSPASSPKHKIDFLFGFPQQSWKLISTQTINTQLSDHLPIISEIELVKN